MKLRRGHASPPDLALAIRAAHTAAASSFQNQQQTTNSPAEQIMSDPLPLSQLDIIPLPALGKLRRFGIASTSDLLRCSTFALAKSLGSLSTLADVRAWQALSSVLEIDGMTLPLARA